MALAVIRVEVVVITLLAAYFIFEHARTKWWRTPAGRQIMIMGSIAIIEHIMLALVVTRVRVSLWWFAILFGLSAAAWGGWIHLMIKVRRRREAASKIDSD